ncbi:unnamed protein product [Rotaria sordida]|uniref:Uncharacterized protein n=1 Tax=Rotaria sordida TaxID=392033 RepID=A0A814V413_9BILA|nr:unnamed protein product [Rotaria sordida]CAF1123503.1 unnamed protein product [Rotaria sordida]CAF1153932.1 unnamed protein product [Rotaria sordida]CAF1183993.1 unnamed protein product [Rotaria sordida]CAF3764794.1 unnamed protein product [Rotaria sordida]
MKKEISIEPLLVKTVNRQSPDANQVHPWIRYLVAGVAAASIYSLIVLILLLAIPIIVLAIGVRYHDPRYCPIEPRISLYLIVHGSVALGLIILNIIISTITIFFFYHRSLISIILVLILSIIILLGTIFSFIWLIIGSVWTFRVNKQVIHEYDTINHYYTYNYCHPVLYRFTFVYLILSYILLVIACCYQCFIRICCPKIQKKETFAFL